MPGTDMVYYATSLCSCYATPGGGGGGKARIEKALLPLLDLFNHHSTASTEYRSTLPRSTVLTLRYDPRSDRFEVKARKGYKVAYSPTSVLRICCAMSGTRICYAVPGTDCGYAATRLGRKCL
eukprot:3095812-Rhodomonas_salina.2